MRNLHSKLLFINMDFDMEEMVEIGPDCSTLGLEADSIPTSASEVNVNRLLTDISSVNEFYGLPKKQSKPSGKIPSTPFKDFDSTIYKPKALFNGFRSSVDRLLFWILACYKVLYEELGKDERYLADWDNKIDDNMVFHHIKCSISDNIKVEAATDEEPPFKVIIRIYLTTSCITIQGLDHKWFSSSIFPKIKDMFNSLLISSPATRATLPTSPAISPSQKKNHEWLGHPFAFAFKQLQDSSPITYSSTHKFCVTSASSGLRKFRVEVNSSPTNL